MRGFSSPIRTKIYLIFLIVSLGLYLVGISNFQEPYFDELTHLPAAREVLAGKENTLRWHPPLNNAFIVASVYLFGDNPYGWRGLSTIFGALLILGVLHLCFSCGLSTRRTVYVGCLMLTSHFVYIHARIAKPDIFFCALLIWALAVLIRMFMVEDPHHKKLLLAFSALLWGFASSIKWLGLIGFVVCFAMLVLLVAKINFPRHRHRQHADGLAWNDEKHLAGVSPVFVVVCFVGVYLLGYVLPYFAIGRFDVLEDASRIWNLQHRIPDNHPYNSEMWNWALMLRPIWYGYHDAGEGLQRGVFCVGNPFVLLSGLICLGWSAVRWWRDGTMLAFLSVVFYCAFYGFWILPDRTTGFHYYYFPAVLFLFLTVGDNFSRLLTTRHRFFAWGYLIIAGGFCGFFLPVLTGMAMPIKDNLHLWAWFTAWI